MFARSGRVTPGSDQTVYGCSSASSKASRTRYERAERESSEAGSSRRRRGRPKLPLIRGPVPRPPA
eukprot:scaffold227240_cov32-Tisochrysis_lutea.AAC.4